MTVETIRIRNSIAFTLPDFKTFMLDVLGSNRMIKDPEIALNELAAMVHKDRLGLFVVKDGEQWTGAVIVQLSETAFNPACIVIHLYCKGAGAETRAELVQAMYNFATEGGYNDIIAIDANNKPQAFAKLFSALGETSILGCVFRFDLRESLL